MADERKLKHLELIQGVINRLSTNSILLKGWSVVLVSALFALSVVDSRGALVLVAVIPVAVFWGLDGFFLLQEQLYRKLYDHVRVQSDENVDFSMAAASFCSDLRPEDKPTWIKATFSKTLIPFHGVLLLSVLGVMYLNSKILDG